MMVILFEPKNSPLICQIMQTLRSYYVLRIRDDLCSRLISNSKQNPNYSLLRDRRVQQSCKKSSHPINESYFSSENTIKYNYKIHKNFTLFD